ncbi:hypothetical protein HDV05_008448 [Chytridiales sp. JEL 0842]|nr:hypothetical protein HDV05_008448 [Chytridiales sp. JEL 0842]
MTGKTEQVDEAIVGLHYPKRIGPQEYFETTSPPANLQTVSKKVDAFVSKHKAAGRRIVLVTSGGTTVPLEAQTVRFIDNFSAGTRGATSTEYFLEAGYAVIFLHRQFSLQPFSRHYSHSKNCFLDYMQLMDDGSIQVNSEYASTMKSVLSKYNKAKNEGLLEMITFVTVSDYLFLLREITRILDTLKEAAMYYLAAAVSDFFIPQSKMTEHKIQSGDGALQLTLDQVPKIIAPLVKEWSPKAFIVSFKLETDADILVQKARGSLNRYGHQVVIGNILVTRKWTVKMITQTEEYDINLTDDDLKSGVEIESLIIPDLIKRHDGWIKAVK